MGLCLGLQECCWAVQLTGYHPHLFILQLLSSKCCLSLFYFTYGILNVKNAENILQVKGMDCVLQQRELNGTLSLWLCDEIW